jgi:Zn-dependent protease
MAERGTLKVGSYRGAPIVLHWSLALGLLVFGGLGIVPGFWLGFTVLILWHEIGHAYLVRCMGFGVERVVVHGFGGFCSWQGNASRLEHAVIAWGGVLAQAMLLGGTLLYVSVFGEPTSAFGYQLQHAWVQTNLWIIALNLLPVAPLDGAEAWQIFRAMRVESVSFGQIVRRCLPRLTRRRGAGNQPGSGKPSVPPEQRMPRGDETSERESKRDGDPSPEARAAIAEALERISRQAREARRKK